MLLLLLLLTHAHSQLQRARENPAEVLTNPFVRSSPVLSTDTAAGPEQLQQLHQAWELPLWSLQQMHQTGGWLALWQGLGCVARLCGMCEASCVLLLVRALHCCRKPAWLQGADAQRYQPATCGPS